MRIRLIAVGQRMPPWIEAGCEEYMKRLPREWNFELTAIKPAVRGKESTGRNPAGSGPTSAAAGAMQIEARAIGEALVPGTPHAIPMAPAVRSPPAPRG